MAILAVLTTASSRAEADRISVALVESRLAACVQVLGPVASRYRWQGEVETTEEWLCLIKSTSEAYPAVEAMITDLHSYDVAEVVALEVVAGTDAYLAWVARETIAP